MMRVCPKLDLIVGESTDLPRCANGSYSIVTSRYLNSSDNIDLQRETDEMMMPREHRPT